MADRYWVGGAGTWNSTNTANWSATSGGAGGASVPTSADNVFFNASSGTGTVAGGGAGDQSNCANFDSSAASVTLASTIYLNVYGSFKVKSGIINYFNGIVFRGSGTHTVDANGATRVTAGGGFNFSGTGTYTFVNNWTSTNGMTVTSGTVNTAGYAISGNAFNCTGSTARTLILGASTLTFVTATAFDFSGTNLTLNAGTSTLISTGSGFNGGTGLTFYNVQLDGTGTLSGTSTYNDLRMSVATTISGANTFASMTVAPPANTTVNVSFGANQTITGTLSVTGGSPSNRAQFQSSVAGTQRTLTVASVAGLANVNFKDIVLAGAASPWSAPVTVWDLGNNSGITFNNGPLYWVGGTGTWSTTAATNWALTSGGAGGAAIPGPSTDVVIDGSSGTGTISLGSTAATNGLCRNLTVTATQSLALGAAAVGYLTIYGGSTLPASGSFTTYVYFVTYAATTTGNNINHNGKQLSVIQLTFSGTGSWQLQSAFTEGTVYFNAGAFTTNNYAVSVYELSDTGTTLSLGSSSVSVGLGAVTITAASFNAGTSTITANSSQFSAAGKAFYNIVGTANSLTATFASCNNFTFNPTGVGSLVFGSSAITVSGTLTVSGADNYFYRLFIRSGSSGGTTITAAATSLTNCDFYNIKAAGAAAWTGSSLGNAGNNSGITFTAAKTVYMVANYTPVAWYETVWATSSGGAVSNANYPLPQDTAYIDNNSAPSGATVNPWIVLGTTTFVNRTNPITLNFGGGYCTGTLTLSSAVTTSTGSFTVEFPLVWSLNSAGRTFYCPLVYTAPDASVTLLADATFTTSYGAPYYGVYCTSAGCSYNLNGYTLTQNERFEISAATFVLNGPGTVKNTGASGVMCNIATAGTPTSKATLELTDSGAGARSATIPNTEATALNLKVSAGTGTFSWTGGATDVNFTGFAGSWTAGTNSIYGSLTVSTGMTVSASASTLTFAATSGTKTITTNGKTLDFPITFNGVGGTWQLVDNLTVGARIVDLTNGTLDLNGKIFTVGNTFRVNAGTKNITFNGGTLLITTGGTAFNLLSAANFTTTAGTGTGKISLSAAGTKTFSGNGGVYNCTLEQAGAGAVTISGSNTFTTISNSVQPTTFTFTSGTTQTVTNFNVSGTSGNLVTINASSTTNAILSKSSGIIDVSYCSISRSTATGGARWQAYTTNGNVNGGNNSGWKFSAFSGNGLFFGSNF